MKKQLLSCCLAALGLTAIQAQSFNEWKDPEVNSVNRSVMHTNYFAYASADEAKAGIKEKSIITEFDGKRIRSIEELVSRLEYYEPGEEVDVTIEVADGDSYKEKTVTVTLGENSEKNQDSDDDSKEKPDQEEPDDQDNDVQDGEDDGSTDSLLRDFLENGMSYEHYHNVW